MSSKKNKAPIVVDAPAPSAGKKTATIISTEATSILKEETLRWLFSIIGSVLVYLVLAFIILHVYHPDVDAMIKEANKISFTGDARPEPMETLLFRTGIVTITLGILLFYTLFSKMPVVKKLSEKPFFLLFSIACVVFVACIIYFDFAAPNPFASGGAEQPQNSRDFVSKTNFSFFFDGFFLGDYLLPFTFILVPIIALIFFYGIKKKDWENNKLYDMVVSGISYLVLGGTVLAIMLINTYEFPYAFENKFDFNAVYYSVTQVYAGMPMLADGFSNTYGLYPQFLNPIFRIIGLNVFNFTLVMSLLIGVVFVLNFVFLKRHVSNKIIWFLGCCTIILFPYFDFRLLTNFDSAFVFYPIRYIIPTTLVFLASLYLAKRSKVIYWVTFVVMGFFILWNPEIGLVSYLSWLAFNTYTDFFTPEGKVAIPKILMHWVVGIVNVLVVFMVYKLLIYAIYGAAPDFGILFSYILHLGAGGFGLLPMVPVHPWNITAIIIILGITYSIVNFCRKNITPKASVIFLVSVISIGFFIYFQGRSHNWPFAVSSSFSLILLTLLGDELWKKVKTTNVLSLNALFVVFLFVISFSFFELVFNAKHINELIYQEDYKEKQADEQKQVLSNEEFINANSKEKEKIFLFTARQYQGLYFNGNKRQTAFNPGIQDMVLISDIAKMENRIMDSSFSIFIEPSYCSFPYLAAPFAAMAATYEVKSTHLTMGYLTKRKTKLPSETFFKQTDNVVTHEKYKDDTASIRTRTNDALGIKPAILAPQFSVQVLFYTKQQIYPYATLAGNMNDSAGFIMANIINTPNYFFGVNGKGFSLPMPDNQWVYCVMNVYPDHLEVYQDGILAGTLPLAKPMRQSPEKLYIGNSGFMRYYVGAISEVSVLNRVLDKNEIQTTWEDIKKQ